jgi:hypothetical protein
MVRTFTSHAAVGNPVKLSLHAGDKLFQSLPVATRPSLEQSSQLICPWSEFPCHRRLQANVARCPIDHHDSSTTGRNATRRKIRNREKSAEVVAVFQSTSRFS